MKTLKKIGLALLFVLWQLLCIPRYLLLTPILVYRRLLSRAKGRPSCRFTPTCSAYGVMAVLNWGVILGIPLTAYRILRCNPWGKGGYDPVPTQKLHRALCRLYGIDFRIEHFFGLCVYDTAEEKPHFDASPSDPTS